MVNLIRRRSQILVLVSILGLIGIASCSEDDAGEVGDNFDRTEMLSFWADELIIPGYQAYVSELNSLNTEVGTFTNNPTATTLENLRTAWLDAYFAWQVVGFYEIGKAEEITLINFTNIYPTNTSDLVTTIESGSYDLTSISKQDEQGFPAIEYLIYGIKDTDAEIIALYSEDSNADKYAAFLADLSERLETLAQSVLTDWQQGYRDTFVSNSGSEATSSVNMLINDYVFYYEKHLRAGKVGIPAGVFSGIDAPGKAEGFYSNRSKALFNAGLDAIQNFFDGTRTDGTKGTSIEGYLQFLNTISQGEDLAEAINLQFQSARESADVLTDNFGVQVAIDNSLMLTTYDELQKNVVNLKVDMLQALNVRVDYVDADGD